MEWGRRGREVVPVEGHLERGKPLRPTEGRRRDAARVAVVHTRREDFVGRRRVGQGREAREEEGGGGDVVGCEEGEGSKPPGQQAPAEAADELCSDSAEATASHLYDGATERGARRGRERAQLRRRVEEERQARVGGS